jgi:hypothetical protein
LNGKSETYEIWVELVLRRHDNIMGKLN